MTDKKLLNQLKDINITLEHISENLHILAWMQEQVLKEEGILPIEEFKRDEYGALEMD